MKQLKRTPNVWKAKNAFLDTNAMIASSYSWWVFVRKVEGKVIFNNYRYSSTTSRHQGAVKSLLYKLGIKIDFEMPIPNGINEYISLQDLILIAEEALCDEFLLERTKLNAKNEKARIRRAGKKLETYLENVVNFRDYTIEPINKFGQVNKIAVHQCVDSNSMERDVENALHSFHRDGFGTVVFYVG